MIFYKLNTKHKDRLFRLIFNEKKELLDLYNAVNESNYTNPDDLEITTMEDVLRKNRNEVIEMILEEWDENEYREYLKEESWNEGHEAGKKIGMEDGKRIGEIKGVIKTCMEFRAPREETLERIKKAFELEQGEAEKYIEEYWK